MEPPLLIHPLIGMPPKEITLRLSQVSRQARPTVAVKIAERGREGWAGDTGSDAEGDDAAPGGLAARREGGRKGERESN